MTTNAPHQATIEHSDLVSPIEDLISILPPFWDQYAQYRESGHSPEESVTSALASLLPEGQCRILSHMLAGDLDWQLSTVKVSFEGRSMLAGLVSSGDRHWQRTRA